jgi:hypothetical protein
LPFQPEAGIQTSILISESEEGASVAVIRQNAGSWPYFAALGGASAGGVNAPAATLSADAIVTLAREMEARFSHDAAFVVPTPNANIASRATKNFRATLVLFLIPEGMIRTSVNA